MFVVILCSETIFVRLISQKPHPSKFTTWQAVLEPDFHKNMCLDMCVISSMCHIYVSAHECQKSFLELDRYGLSDADGGNETWVQLPECSAAGPVPQNHQIICTNICRQIVSAQQGSMNMICLGTVLVSVKECGAYKREKSHRLLS